MTTEVMTGEWVLCRGMAVHVTEEEIARAMHHGRSRRDRRRFSRERIVENVALGKRIGTYREWPRTKEEA